MMAPTISVDIFGGNSRRRFFGGKTGSSHPIRGGHRLSPPSSPLDERRRAACAALRHRRGSSSNCRQDRCSSFCAPLKPALLALALVACGSGEGSAGEDEATTLMVHALQLDESSADTLLMNGPRADGDVGDFAIYNEVLVAIVDQVGFDEATDLPLQHHRAPTGGTLLDLGVRAYADQLLQVYQGLAYEPDLRVYYHTLEVVEDAKALQATGLILDPGQTLGGVYDERGLVEGIVVTTTYRMTDGSSWLELETVITNQSGRVIDLGPVCDVFVTDGLGLETFVPSPGWGFELVDDDAIVAPWATISGSPEHAASYAVVAPDPGYMYVVPFIDEDGRVRSVMTGEAERGRPALWPGETRRWTRLLTGQPSADAARVSGMMFDLLGSQSGSYYITLGLRSAMDISLQVSPAVDATAVFHRTDPPHYLSERGEVLEGGYMPLSAARSDEDALLQARLPQGGYEVEISSYGYDDTSLELDLSSGVSDYGIVELQGGEFYDVTLDVVDEDGGAVSGPLRLTVAGLGGTPDPDLEGAAAGKSAVVSRNRIWSSGGEFQISLLRGTYRALVSRGPAYEIAAFDFYVPDTTTLKLAMDSEPEDMGGWISMDPFSASRFSLFGGDQPGDVALALGAEGVDLCVRAEAQEREKAETGFSGQAVSTGVLGTLDVPRAGAPSGDGWLVAFPVQESLPGPGLSPASWLDLAWEAGAVYSAILAPHAEGAGGAARGNFEAQRFVRGHIEDEEQNPFLYEESEAGSLITDVTALELLSARDPWHTKQSVKDWYALLQQGIWFAPAASSHCSWLEHDNPGAARTMVYASQLDADTVAEAAAQGLSYATSGPLIDVYASRDGYVAVPGQTLGGDGFISLNLKVSAPSWVPVSSVRVYLEGEEHWSVEPEATEGVRVSEQFAVPLDGAEWLVVEAGDASIEPGGDFSLIYPNMPSFAITAPIRME